MALFPVTIQITPESRPTIPPWMGEVAAFAQVLTGVCPWLEQVRPVHAKPWKRGGCVAKQFDN
jgi:hypothetical protein